MREDGSEEIDSLGRKQDGLPDYTAGGTVHTGSMLHSARAFYGCIAEHGNILSRLDCESEGSGRWELGDLQQLCILMLFLWT